MLDSSDRGFICKGFVSASLIMLLLFIASSMFCYVVGFNLGYKRGQQDALIGKQMYVLKDQKAFVEKDK